MTGEIVISVVGTVCTLLTFVAKGIFDERRRRQDKEDAIADGHRQGELTRDKIDENTKISTDAFEVANHANEKIAGSHETAALSNEAVLLELAKMRREGQETRELVRAGRDSAQFPSRKRDEQPDR